MPNKISQFWQELKRRKVTRTVTIYAAAAFVILELVSMSEEPFGLPEWTFVLAVILLSIGFIISIIISWIYDIHPEGGIVKTEHAEKMKTGDIPKSSRSWKVASYISFVVILIMVGIMLYPKIFRGDQYKTVRNEAGQIHLAVLPFENQTGDSSLDWISTGISSMLTNGLGSSEELLVYNDQGMGEIIDAMKEINAAGITGSQAPDIARIAGAQAYISGSFQGRGDKYRILANLVSTEGGDILQSWQVDGNLNSDAVMNLLDSLGRLIRDQLEIHAMEQEADFDFRRAYTSSAEAYRYYIGGMNAIIRCDFNYAIEHLKKALEIDSTFAFATFYIAIALNWGTGGMEELIVWVTRAHELRSALPMIYQQWIELWYTWVTENDLTKLRQQLSALESYGIESRLFWKDLGDTRLGFTNDPDQALKNYEMVIQISERRGDPWRLALFYAGYGAALSKMGRHQEAEEIFRQGLELTNDRSATHLFYWWSVDALARGDSAMASEKLEEWRLNLLKLEEQDSYEFRRCRLFYRAKDYQRAEAETRLFLLNNPNSEEGRLLLANTLIEGELDPQEGLDSINSWLALDPENLQLLDSKAFGLHKLGRHREALELLEKNTSQYKAFNLKHHLYLQEVREAIPGSL